MSQQHAIYLDGKTSFVELPTSCFPVADQISVALWAHGGDDLPSQNCVLGATTPGVNRILLVHLPWQDQVVYFDCGPQGNTFDRIHMQSEPGVYKGRWTHWVFTKDVATGQMTIYQDGHVAHQEDGKTRPLQAPAVVTVGRLKLGNKPYCYHGYLRELSLWDRALSPAEVSQLRDSGPRGIEGLHAYYPLDDSPAAGNAIRDQSGNGHHGINHGATWHEIDVPFGIDRDEELTTGLEDYGFWWRVIREQKRTAKDADPPFRRGRIWA